MTEILLELEWKQQCHSAQVREAEMSDSEPLVVSLGDGATTSKRGRRRAREQGKGKGTFGRPADWTVPTRHLYVANTGPKFGVSAGDLMVHLNKLLAGTCGNLESGKNSCAVQRVTVVKPTLPFVYVTFHSIDLAVQARRSLDRRVAGSSPLNGRQITAEFAEERYVYAMCHVPCTTSQRSELSLCCA